MKIKKKRTLVTVISTLVLTLSMQFVAFAFPMNNSWATNEYVGWNFTTTGNIVRCVQILVSAAGFNPGTIDGIFGYNTASAVTSYQGAHGLVTDGAVGANTWSEMQTHLWNIGISHYYNPYTGVEASTQNYGWAIPNGPTRDAGFIRFNDAYNWIVMDKYGNEYWLW